MSILSNNFYYQPLKIDSVNTQVYGDFVAKEGDANGRGLLVTLTENGLQKDTTGITLNLKWAHTTIAGLQGLEPFESIDLTKGLYKITYPTNMLRKGKVDAFIQIIDSGSVIGSRNIKINVEATVGDDTAIESSNEFTALVSALVEVQGWNARIDDVEQEFIDKANNLDATYPTRLVSVETGLEQTNAQVDLLNRGLGETFATLTDLQTAYPTGDTKDHIVGADGHRYYWNDTAWADGGAYQAVEVFDGTIRTNSLDGFTSDLIGIDKIDFGWVRAAFSSGAVNVSATDAATTNNFILLDKDVEIKFDSIVGNEYNVAYYTLAGVFTGVYDGWTTAANKIIPANATSKIRVSTRYIDRRTNININEILKYISVVKKTMSVDLLENRIAILETNGNEIPSYWQAHLQTKIDTINALQKQVGYNGTSFGFITDLHYNNNSKKSHLLLNKVMNDCEIPYYIDGGDTAANPLGVPKATQIEEIKAAKAAFEPLESRCLRALGNHDDNSINNLYSMTITDKEMYDLLFRHNSQYQQIKSGDTGNYFYADDEMHKIRYIVLNVLDIPYTETVDDGLLYTGMATWAIRQEQMDWFADNALNVPNAQWSVVVCTHVPINYGYLKNDSIAMNILQAFKDKTTYTGSANVGTDFEVTKSVDYTSKGGDVICWLSGHTHLDSYTTLPGNITFKAVITINDSLHIQTNAPTKTLGTETENAFDVFTIDKANRKVNITRIGAGSDREFIY